MTHLLLYLLLEPIKRVLSALLYPFVYPFRGMVRSDRTMHPEYLYEPKNWVCVIPWLFLDDSIFIETKKECAKQETKYPSWIAKRGDFIRSYWWSAIRNSFVNWNNYSAFRLGTYVKRHGFMEMREYSNGQKRLYMEFWVFGRWNQIGWLSGTPRFEIDIMKKR